MSEILKDTSGRIATLCKCRDYAPNSKDIRDCQKSCEFFDGTKQGGWCLHYRKGSKMCTHVEEPKPKDKRGCAILLQ